MEKLLNLKEAAEFLHVSKSTLRRWDYEGKLKSLKTTGNHRRYKLSDLKDFINIESETELTNDKSEVRVATYARCSKQQGDLDKQSQRLFEYCVSNNYKVTNIIKDIGSGINDRRKGFLQLCDLVVNNKIDKVIIEHKDILTRFQYDLIEYFFKQFKVTIELLDNQEYSVNEELVDDITMLLASFSGRLYSARAKENKVD